MLHLKKQVVPLYLVAVFLCFGHILHAQTDYRNLNQLTREISSLKQKHGAHVKLQSLTKTIGGHDIWALTLSNGNPSDNPAIAIVGGVDGQSVLSSELVVGIANNILENHKEVLDNTTFYIFPNMSPNAYSNYFSNLKFPFAGNAKKTDDDRDGEFNEDPFDDLNNDGLITLMRIEDSTGSYIKFEEDDRIMVKADTKKGETGNYKVFSEGIDNDKDESFNEDGNGGVVFNNNLSYNFNYFSPGSGEHPVSEKEHRALLDFLYEQWNIYAVLTIGPSNNLSTPLKYNKGGASKRVVTSILKKDADLNAFLSETYNKITKSKDAPKTESHPGGFFEWSYFHFGKLAMSTPGWWVPKFKGDSINKATKNSKLNFLKWAEKEQLTDYFVEWKPIEHPDFPGKKVEIGGIAPFKMQTPPYSYLADISKKHTDFIVKVASLQAKIAIENVEVETLSNGVSRVTVAIHNKGFLPTHTEMGARSRWLRRIKVQLKLNNGQELISGQKITLLNSLDGDESTEMTWLIKGKGAVNLSAGAAHTGTDNQNINLN